MASQSASFGSSDGATGPQSCNGRITSYNVCYTKLFRCKADTFIMSSNLWIVVDKCLASLGECPDGRTVYGHVSPAHCLDCREKGGVLDKPDFFD